MGLHWRSGVCSLGTSSHILEVRGEEEPESNILSCCIALMFIQVKPGQGQKYLQNTYYVSGVMLGTLHTLSHLTLRTTLGSLIILIL